MKVGSIAVEVQKASKDEVSKDEIKKLKSAVEIMGKRVEQIEKKH
jgi:hypothetical protein